MPTLTFTTKYKKNTGLLLSASDLLANYLYGVQIKAGDGTDFSEANIEFFIEAAQREVEQYLGIKFQFQLFDDNGSYHKDDYFNSFPLLKTRYPVVEPLSVIGFYKKIEQISYPATWLSAHRNGDGIAEKRISIVPTAGSATLGSTQMILSGATFLWGSLRGNNQLPDYWQYQYTTGYTYDNLPMDLINLVGKFASIGPLNTAGDLILGAGIASQSLSIDGLSQSISTTSSATNAGYGSRILQYTKEVKDTLEKLKVVYRGISFTVL